jgi:hypothetical protein
MRRRSRLFKWSIYLLTALLLVVGVSSLFDHGHRRGGDEANGRMYTGSQSQNFDSRNGQAGFQQRNDPQGDPRGYQQNRNGHHEEGGWLGWLGAFLITLVVIPLLIPIVGLLIAAVLIVLLMRRLRRQRPRWMSGQAGFVAQEENASTTYNAQTTDFLDQWEKEVRAKNNHQDQ